MQRGACERARGDNRVGELDEELARQADPGDANRIGHSIGLQARISTAHKDVLIPTRHMTNASRERE